MFPPRWRIQRNESYIDGLKRVDELEVHLYTPNGEDEIGSFTIPTIGVDDLIQALEKYR